MKAMIFAAGLGTRLKPLTDTMPKALVPIGGKPLLEWQIEKLRNAGINDIVINVHHFPDQIRSFLKEKHNLGCNILLSDESERLLETGGGIRKAAPLLGHDEPVLAINVDILSNIRINDLIAAHRPDSMATLVVSERQTQRYLLFDEQNRMAGWTNIATGEVKGERFTRDNEKVDDYRKLAFSGIHILSPALIAQMEEWQEAFPIMDFYLSVCDKQILRAYIPDNYRMMDIGKIDHLDEAEAFGRALLAELSTGG